MKIETEFTNTPEKDAHMDILEAASTLAKRLNLTGLMRTYSTMLVGVDHIEVWYRAGLFISQTEKAGLPREWEGYPVTYRFSVKPAVALNV